tara:strand:- start:7100 stop:7630 length:531 start_codon:yes stop_codon:yes gene_type:complete
MTNDVLMELPDVPKPLINIRMGKVITDFCERTNAWQEDDSHTAISAQTDYLLVKSTHGEIIRIMKVTVDGNEVAYGNYELKYKSISFMGSYVPSANSTIVVTMSLIPNSGYCPDWFITKYKKYLISGCVSSLMMMPKRPWTDYGASKFYEKDFFKGVGLELYRASCGGSNNSGVQA